MPDNITLPPLAGTIIGSKDVGGGVQVQRTILENNPGDVRSHGTTAPIAATSAGTVYALLGIKANAGSPNLKIALQQLSLLATTNDDYEWLIYENPIVAGTFTFSPLANSQMDVATGSTANTVTGGIIGPRSFGEGNTRLQTFVETEYKIGMTGNEIILAVNPRSNGLNIEASWVWRELF